MIICIDIGNTNVKYAIFDGDELKISFRVATDLKKLPTNTVRNS